MVVIVVIGILASLTLVAYTSIQSKVIETALASDVDKLSIAELRYIDEHGSTAKSYYSGNGFDTDLNFSPTEGNVIDVVSDSAGYCIRGYNLTSTNNSIDNAFTKESSPGTCDRLEPSASATGQKGWKQISAGDYHTCAISEDDKAFCWGYNNYGQLGDGTTTNSSAPVSVSTAGLLGGKTIKSIETGGNFTCVIASDDLVYCWGYNNYGQLGNNTANSTPNPLPVAVSMTGVLSGKTVKSISMNESTMQVCVIASDNLAYCWGSNWDGQLGNGLTADSPIPVAVLTTGVLSGKTIKSISIHDFQACAIASDDLIYCWGNNFDYEFGIGTSDMVANPPKAAAYGGSMASKTAKVIANAGMSTCAIASDDQAYCWGSNGTYYRLGNNSTAYNYIPGPVTNTGALSGKTLKTMSSGSNSTCVIASDNKAYCWGYNAYGGLGDGTTVHARVPTPVNTGGVLSGKTVKSISVGRSHACAIASDNQAYCWGYNLYGGLGDGSTTHRSLPIAVPSPI